LVGPREAGRKPENLHCQIPCGFSRLAFGRFLNPPLTGAVNGSSFITELNSGRVYENAFLLLPEIGIRRQPGPLIFATIARADLPVIESIRVESTNLIVTARVPAGRVRVVLESRDALNSGAWVPVAVQRLSGQGGVLTFNLPRAGSFACCAFAPMPSRSCRLSSMRGPTCLPPASFGCTDGLTLYGPGTPPDSGSNSREVVESDIWRLDGDTLYFFNQHRGLQIIDVSKPDEAVLARYVESAGGGEQMYLLRSNYVVLLTQGLCGSYTAIRTVRS